jgi:hypothetical protein
MMSMVDVAIAAGGPGWNVAWPPVPTNGHCVVGVGYTPNGVTISTWGMLGLKTDAATAKYPTTISAGELYAVGPSAGFDSQLVADFASMGGNVSHPQQRAVRRNVTNSARNQRALELTLAIPLFRL